MLASNNWAKNDPVFYLKSQNERLVLEVILIFVQCIQFFKTRAIFLIYIMPYLFVFHLFAWITLKFFLNIGKLNSPYFSQ